MLRSWIVLALLAVAAVSLGRTCARRPEPAGSARPAPSAVEDSRIDSGDGNVLEMATEFAERSGAGAEVASREAAPEIGLAVARPASLSGRVSSAVGSRNLYGATVVARSLLEAEPWQVEVSTRTAVDGSYHLDGVRPGALRLLARKKGYQLGVRSFDGLRPGEHRVVDLALEPFVSLRGRVQWPDGSPAIDASVQVTAEGPNGVVEIVVQDERADEEGRFALFVRRPGPFSIRARAVNPSLPTFGPLGSFGPSADAPWSAELVGAEVGDEEWVLVLEEPAWLLGVLVDDLGEPWPDFRIEAYTPRSPEEGPADSLSRSFRTTDGRFAVPAQPATWRVTAIVGGRRTGPVLVQLERGAEPEREPLRIVLERPASVRGRVVDPAGRPASSASVVARQEAAGLGGWINGAEVRADEDGAFEMSALGTGTYTLTASLTGFSASRRLRVDLAPDQTSEGLLLRLRRAGRITGELHPSIKRRGGVGISATMLGGEFEHRITQEDGSFAFDGLAEGTWELSAWLGDEPKHRVPSNRHADFERVTSVLLAPGGEAHVVLGQPPGPGIRMTGRITRGGKPVDGIVVRAQPMTMGLIIPVVPQATTDEHGAFELTVPEPGGIFVTLARTERDPIAIVQLVVPDEVEFVHDFELPDGGLRGVVRGEDGLPRSGVSVMAILDWKPGGRVFDHFFTTGLRAETDGEGHYALEGVGVGRYFVLAGVPRPEERFAIDAAGERLELGMSSAAELSSEGEFTEGVDIVVRPGADLKGRVTNSAGAGLGSVSVEVLVNGRSSAEWSGLAFTNADGRFEIRNLVSGPAVVFATDGEAESPRQEVTLHSGDSIELDLRLDR